VYPVGVGVGVGVGEGVGVGVAEVFGVPESPDLSLPPQATLSMRRSTGA